MAGLFIYMAKNIPVLQNIPTFEVVGGKNMFPQWGSQEVIWGSKGPKFIHPGGGSLTFYHNLCMWYVVKCSL